ncbi:MAG TPA: hypothetical protein VMM56_15800 [Planctomycetaceae bacterium]|nr:hypothetical protein [Planctomycetaceae bacterium]
MKSREMEGRKVKCKKCGKPFVVEFGDEFEDEFGGGFGGGAMPPVTIPPRVQGVKTKKKTKAEPGEESAPRKAAGSKKKKQIIIASSLVGALLIFTGVMFALSSPDSQQQKQQEVVNLQFTKGESEQHKFGVEYPADWEFKTGGGTGGKPEFVRITAPDISISIKTNLKASAFGDIAGAGGVETEELPDELEPIHQVHEAMKANMTLDMTPYDEQPPESIETKSGEGRLSKYVGDRGMLNGGKAYGFRATIPSRPDMLVVVITCESQKVFDKYEETFRKIILSIGH